MGTQSELLSIDLEYFTWTVSQYISARKSMHGHPVSPFLEKAVIYVPRVSPFLEGCLIYGPPVSPYQEKILIYGSPVSPFLEKTSYIIWTLSQSISGRIAFKTVGSLQKQIGRLEHLKAAILSSIQDQSNMALPVGPSNRIEVMEIGRAHV